MFEEDSTASEKLVFLSNFKEAMAFFSMLEMQGFLSEFWMSLRGKSFTKR